MINVALTVPKPVALCVSNCEKAVDIVVPANKPVIINKAQKIKPRMLRNFPHFAASAK